MNNESQISVESTNVSAVDASVAEDKLISATEARLEKVYEGEVSTPISDVESAISTPISDVESAISTPISDVESAESVASTVTKESAESVASTVTKESADKLSGLPDAYYRAAKHQEWSDSEIKAFYTKDPVLAKKTFAKLYDSTNKLSREFAAIGRAKQEAAKVVPGVKPDDSTKKSDEFKAINIEQLRKDYDNDPIVELVAQTQEQNKILFEKVQSLGENSGQALTEEQELRIKIQEEAMIEQQIGQFFDAPDLKSYGEFYGKPSKDSKNWDELTVAQKANRWNLLQMADQIILGAESQGRKMTVNDGLALAHLNVSEPIREKVIRDGIKAKVTTRSKGLSLKPSGTKSVEGIGVTSGKDLERVVAERLAKTFG